MTRPLGPEEQHHDEAVLTRALPHEHERRTVLCANVVDGCVRESACAALTTCGISFSKSHSS